MSHPILDVVGQVEDYTEEAAWNRQRADIGNE